MKIFVQKVYMYLIGNFLESLMKIFVQKVFNSHYQLK